MLWYLLTGSPLAKGRRIIFTFSFRLYSDRKQQRYIYSTDILQFPNVSKRVALALAGLLEHHLFTADQFSMKVVDIAECIALNIL